DGKQGLLPRRPSSKSLLMEFHGPTWILRVPRGAMRQSRIERKVPPAWRYEHLLESWREQRRSITARRRCSQQRTTAVLIREHQFHFTQPESLILLSFS